MKCEALKGTIKKRASGKYQGLFIILILSLAPFFSHSQRGQTTVFTGEKVYLQLSSKIYTIDEPIWFKVLVVNDQNHNLTTKSRVLHVELINPNGEKVTHQKIKLTEGIGHGSLELASNSVEGRYLIRAYTRWNRNFEDNFIFEEYIYVATSSNSKTVNLLDSLAHSLKNNGSSRLYGSINEGLTNLLNDKKNSLYLKWQDERDTIVIKKNKDRFTFNYDIPTEVNWINLNLRIDSINYDQTILLKEVDLDLQFLPESGRLIHGFQNKLGFKALGQDGKGIDVSGTIYNNQGKKITDFSSNHLGMGLVTFQPDSTQSYYAKLDSADDSLSKKTYPLPKVYAQGSILSISKIGKKILIKTASNKEGYVYIKIACRGQDYFLVQGPLQNGYLTKALASEELPNGILKFTLMNKNRHPIAERLFFNDSEIGQFTFEISTNKNEYVAREKTELNIRVTDGEIDFSTLNLSVTAINKEHWHQGKGETILSYFLLSSEIRGDIEQPGYYLQEGHLQNSKDLDALLLTQGWRNYKYPITEKSDSLFLPEKGIEIKGRVHFPFQNEKLAKNVNVNLATFGRNSTFYAEKTNSLGRFRFLLNDEYGLLPVFLNADENNTKNKIDYNIQIDEFQPSDFTYRNIPIFHKNDTLLKPLREMHKLRNNTPKAFSTEGMNELDEVLLTGKGSTSKELERYKKYGEPDVIISGEEIREKEKKWSYGLYSILLFNYGDQIEIEKFSDGFMLAHIRAGRGEPTLLLIDGQLLKKHQYELVPHMDPGVVERVELIKYAKFFKNRYLEVFPEADPLKSPLLGHIISITTKGGGGIFEQGQASPGTLRTSVEGFAQVKEFYSPKYERTLIPGEKKSDFRTLVHWVPSLGINQDGKASIQFYNPDVSGEYVIIVEGITQDGKIGYREKNYTIKN